MPSQASVPGESDTPDKPNCVKLKFPFPGHSFQRQPKLLPWMGQTVKCMSKVPSDHLLHRIKLMPWLHKPILRIHTSKLLSLPHGECFKPTNRQLRKWEKSTEACTTPTPVLNRWGVSSNTLEIHTKDIHFCFSDILQTHRHTTNIKLTWVLPLRSTTDQ